jgi:endothelin-converting enzyme
MDDSVNPCDDFYQFACGGWMKAHPIPAGESRWDAFGVLRKQNQVVLKNILELPINESVSESEVKAKKYYNSCLDPNKFVESLGAAPLVSLIRDEFNGWTVAGSNHGDGGGWNKVSWNFQETLEKIHALGLSNFFSVWVGEDEKNPQTNILQFDQGGIVLQKDQYMNKTTKDDKVLGAYLKFMTDTAILLGGDNNKSVIQQLLQDVVDFEQAVADITVAQEDRRDDERLYHKMTLKDLQTMSQFIDWKHYVNQLFSVTNYTVDENESILVYEPSFMTSISELVNKTLHSPNGNRTLHNYMIWHVVKMLTSYLSKPFQDIKKEFLKVLSGVSGDEEQWRYCVSDTDGILGFAVGSLFVRETFHGESKSSAEQMIQRVKTAFIDNLPSLKWMDSDTRKAAIGKAEAVVDMIGFPEFILNTTQLDDRYKDLEVNESEYFNNNIRYIKYSMKRNLEKLRQPVQNNSWSMSPSTVNAYYTPTKNEIVFPAGILQAPFYDKAYPKSLNYGAMGVVMGHELTHGFDDQGREYDKSGVLQPWWKPESVSKFNESAQCFVEQYNSYTAYGEHLKGRQTLGENIADNGGLKSAYHAYINWVKENGEEYLLPGLNFTHPQLFFIAFGQVWCSNSRPEDSHLSILADPHSLPRYRVIGSISNSREFSQLFNCPPTANMNPVHKCEIW